VLYFGLPSNAIFSVVLNWKKYSKSPLINVDQNSHHQGKWSGLRRNKYENRYIKAKALESMYFYSFLVLLYYTSLNSFYFFKKRYSIKNQKEKFKPVLMTVFLKCHIFTVFLSPHLHKEGVKLFTNEFYFDNELVWLLNSLKIFLFTFMEFS
jgi:hypothetical protein